MSGITAIVTSQPITATVSGSSAISATVGSTTFAATVGGGVGPQGPAGPTGPTGSGATDWGDVSNKPTTFTPSAHNHTANQILDLAAAVASLAPPPTTNASLITSGTLAESLLPANVVLVSNAALTDARTPTSHAVSHAVNGSDPLTLAASQISDFTNAVVAAAPPTTNASLLNSGVLSDARLSGNVVLVSNAALTDARTPTSHAASHAANGSDALTLSSSQITGLGSAAAAVAEVWVAAHPRSSTPPRLLDSRRRGTRRICFARRTRSESTGGTPRIACTSNSDQEPDHAAELP